jgi:hypothetical protein
MALILSLFDKYSPVAVKVRFVLLALSGLALAAINVLQSTVDLAETVPTGATAKIVLYAAVGIHALTRFTKLGDSSMAT